MTCAIDYYSNQSFFNEQCERGYSVALTLKSTFVVKLYLQVQQSSSYGRASEITAFF